MLFYKRDLGLINACRAMKAGLSRIQSYRANNAYLLFMEVFAFVRKYLPESPSFLHLRTQALFVDA